MVSGSMSTALPAGWRHASFDEIDSTNAEAMRRIAAGERGQLWITARFQSRGRGRSGRSWSSADGSLAATLMVTPGCAPAALPQLSLLAGVATHDAIAGALPAGAQALTRLKWPNDVLIAGAKASGILVESTAVGADVVAVIGIGINIAAPPELGDRPTTSLATHGAAIDVSGMSIRLAASLATWLETWDRGARFDAVRSAWLERAGPPGMPMTVHAGGVPVSGAYVGLDIDGALLLDTTSGRQRFTFGDVALGPG
jgi:BirA family biotin operon repressor/biotin-[acetyl-CoA-carboxylase] ligase